MCVFVMLLSARFGHYGMTFRKGDAPKRARALSHVHSHAHVSARRRR